MPNVQWALRPWSQIHNESAPTIVITIYPEQIRGSRSPLGPVLQLVYTFSSAPPSFDQLSLLALEG
jgi:hypothetical protein